MGRKNKIRLIKKIKTWHPRLKQQWLAGVNILRERADRIPQKRKHVEITNKHSPLYLQRSRNLKRFSTPQFHAWRMRHHKATA